MKERRRQAGLASWLMLAVSLMPGGFVACGVTGAETASSHPRPATEAAGVTLVQQYGGRAPRPCPAITHKPSDPEAAILAQCTMEGPFSDTETLLTDVKVHIAGSRPFGIQDFNRKDIDNRADILTLTGYATQYACGMQSFSPGKNCTRTEMPNSPGACWKTNYGEYRCNFVNVGEGYHPFIPPPTKY